MRGEWGNGVRYLSFSAKGASFSSTSADARLCVRHFEWLILMEGKKRGKKKSHGKSGKKGSDQIALICVVFWHSAPLLIRGLFLVSAATPLCYLRSVPLLQQSLTTVSNFLPVSFIPFRCSPWDVPVERLKLVDSFILRLKLIQQRYSFNTRLFTFPFPRSLFSFSTVISFWPGYNFVHSKFFPSQPPRWTQYSNPSNKSPSKYPHPKSHPSRRRRSHQAFL